MHSEYGEHGERAAWETLYLTNGQGTVVTTFLRCSMLQSNPCPAQGLTLPFCQLEGWGLDSLLYKFLFFFFIILCSKVGYGGKLPKPIQCFIVVLIMTSLNEKFSGNVVGHPNLHMAKNMGAGGQV